MKKICFYALMVIQVVNILLCIKLPIHASTAENEEFSASYEWQNPLYEAAGFESWDISNSKKLKNITIKSKKLTTKNVGTKAFAKISSNVTIKVPKNKLKTYKTMLIKRGVSKKATIKK